MNGAFRYEPTPVFGDRLANIRSWWQRCHAVKADGLLITSWEAYRLALETTTVVDAAAANLWLEPAQDDATAMLARGLERMFKSKSARTQARALLAADAYAFTGYARWQINDRWDVFAGNESLKPYQAELRFFERLLTGSYDWPGAFAASIAFRIYIAQRDLFVREAARNVFQWRRRLAKVDTASVIYYMTLSGKAAGDFGQALKAGRKAAQAMWARTRDLQARGQNEALLEADAKRLAEWRAWLKLAAKKPTIITLATPVCGAWQLQFMVHNFAPAVQKVIVEQQGPDGSWIELVSRHTIEFRAYAARPRTKIKREFTVPIDSPKTPLRLRVGGVGQVAISHVTATNGINLLTGSKAKGTRVLGSPPVTQGFPDLSHHHRNSILVVKFNPRPR